MRLGGKSLILTAMKLVLLVTAMAVLGCDAAENTLTPAEKSEGWVLLFDGQTYGGWLDPAKKNPPGDSWVIDSGMIRTRLKPRIAEDLLSEREYRDFELKFDWRVSPGGNTGLKYRLQRALFVDESKTEEGPGGFEGMLGRELAGNRSDRAKLAPDGKAFEYTIGFEFQLIDDAKHPDALRGPDRRTGALYSMIPAKTSTARPAGEWNSSVLRVVGDNFEHSVNGVKVLEGSLKDPAVRAGVEKRWKDVPAIREMLTNPKPAGRIALQHHGDEVWFRNLKIRELSGSRPR